MAGVSTLQSALGTTFRVTTIANNLTGAIYNPVSNSVGITKNQSLGTASANAVTGGADEAFSFQQKINAASSATLNLNNMTNLLSQAGITLARIKGWQIRLLSASDDSTISPAPTGTSTVTVTNIGVATPNPLDFGNGGTGAVVALTTGGGAVTATAVSAGGSGYPPSAFFLMSPQQAGGSGNVFLAGTTAGGVITSMTFISGTGGTGYSNAAVNAIPVGQYNILTGGAHMYLDPAAGGFAAVSATANNILIINMDQTNAVTVEIDVIGGTS